MEQTQYLGLLKKVATGNKVAFEALYQASSSQLYAVSFKIMQNRDLADDVLQEAFIKIWHNAADYSTDKGNVLTWMISIVRYRAFDALRFQKVRTGAGRDDETVLMSEDTASLSEQEKKQLDYCLEELDNIQKQAIHLAFFNGLTHQEVATHISRPLGSSKSLIRRGMQSLKRCLGL